MGQIGYRIFFLIMDIIWHLPISFDMMF